MSSFYCIYSFQIIRFWCEAVYLISLLITLYLSFSLVALIVICSNLWDFSSSWSSKTANGSLFHLERLLLNNQKFSFWKTLASKLNRYQILSSSFDLCVDQREISEFVLMDYLNLCLSDVICFVSSKDSNIFTWAIKISSFMLKKRWCCEFWSIQNVTNDIFFEWEVDCGCHVEYCLEIRPLVRRIVDRKQFGEIICLRRIMNLFVESCEWTGYERIWEFVWFYWIISVQYSEGWNLWCQNCSFSWLSFIKICRWALKKQKSLYWLTAFLIA